MKIAINTLSLNRTKAGMGNYIKNLVSSLALIDKSNEYHIFVSEKNKQFFNIDQKNIKIINLGKPVTNRLFRLLWEQFVLPGYVKKNKIDVLHSPGFVVPFLSKAKNIVTVADTTFMTHPKVHTLLKRSYFSLMMPRSIKKADKVISISESTKKDILDSMDVDPNKIKVTHLAHDNKFRVMDRKESKVYIEKKYEIKGHFFLFVGMIEPRKNLKRIARATKILGQKLVIVGKKGWKTNFLKDMDTSNIIFTDYINDDDLVKFYNASEALLYPCLYEGFGIPVIEAMACGCPVITSKISSMPEVAGDAAILVNPKSVNEIASAIKKVGKARKDLIRKGLDRSKDFSWQKTAEKTLQTYLEVNAK